MATKTVCDVCNKQIYHVDPDIMYLEAHGAEFKVRADLDLCNKCFIFGLETAIETFKAEVKGGKNEKRRPDVDKSC